MGREGGDANLLPMQLRGPTWKGSKASFLSAAKRPAGSGSQRSGRNAVGWVKLRGERLAVLWGMETVVWLGEVLVGRCGGSTWEKGEAGGEGVAHSFGNVRAADVDAAGRGHAGDGDGGGWVQAEGFG